MDLLNRRSIQMLCVSLGVFVVYYVTRRVTNPYNQYVLLTDAFLHKRLWLINPPSYLETARFGAKWFVIDPPAPTLFLFPVVAIFHTGADNVLVSCGVGALAVGFFWIAATNLWTNQRVRIAMTVLIAFGTNFWWVSSDGGFWSFAHVSAVFFLMAGLAEATGRKRGWLVGICVALAGLSRLPCFLIFPLYAYLVTDGRLREERGRVVQLLAAVAGGAAFYLGYNRVRYGTFADRGYNHPQYLHEPWFARGRFNLTYIPRHIRAIFFEWPHFSHVFPYVRPDYIGMALLFTTPMFLYAFRARLNGRTMASLVGLVLVSIPLVTHGATGWSQFGYRYALDATPALVLLTASGLRDRVSKVAIGLLAYCVLVNLWGTLAFNRFNWVV
jgi:hypothetical protein